MLPLLHTTQPLDDAPRSVIENAVLMWLEPLHIRQGGYLKTLDHYHGELDTEEGFTALFARMRGAAPAVLVATGEGLFNRESARAVKYRSTMEVETLVVSNLRRSREAQAIGDELGKGTATSDPGVYKILADVHSYLSGRSVGDRRMGRFEPEFTNVVIQLPELAMWRHRFKLTWNLDVLTDDELQGRPAVTSIHHKHNLVDDTVDADPPQTINPVAEGLAT